MFSQEPIHVRPAAIGRGVGAPESLYYVTVLSNLVRGYDKYARVYDKSRIPESTFSRQFFLLARHELHIGIAKASSLLQKLQIPGNCLIALETHAYAHELHPNLRTGRGRFLEQHFIALDAIHHVDESGELCEIRIEEACALSLRLHIEGSRAYEQIVPRSVSILPIARACQAKCPFCFSKASVSAEMLAKPIDWQRVAEVLRQGKLRGAERAVITGGGEPSLLADGDLDRLIREAAAVFPKVVLISNGFKWGRMEEAERAAALQGLDAAGLSVLAISRHHFDSARNSELMHLHTQSEQVAQSWSAAQSSLHRLKLRWICVL